MYQDSFVHSAPPPSHYPLAPIRGAIHCRRVVWSRWDNILGGGQGGVRGDMGKPYVASVRSEDVVVVRGERDVRGAKM